MKRNGLTCVLTMLLAGWVGGCAATPASEAVRDGVFIHIESGVQSPHQVMMGLRMAEVMAGSRDVLVYCDVDGIEVVLKDSPDMKLEPFGSSHAMLQGLIDRGVTIYACPGCMKVAGKTAADLRPGVVVADKDGFFAFTQGRILTLDY